MDKILPENQKDTYEADGCGQSKDSEAKTLYQFYVHVRKDSQIPSFDALSDLRYLITPEDPQDKYTQTLIRMVLDGAGMFLEDILKLQEKDIFSAAGEEIHPKDSFPIPSLKALKKAVCNYFLKSGQQERYRKATETVICSCRHVTDYEITDCIEKGQSTYEEISRSTGLGTGCGSCIPRAKSFIKTSLGKI